MAVIVKVSDDTKHHHDSFNTKEALAAPGLWKRVDLDGAFYIYLIVLQNNAFAVPCLNALPLGQQTQDAVFLQRRCPMATYQITDSLLRGYRR